MQLHAKNLRLIIFQINNTTDTTDNKFIFNFCKQHCAIDYKTL